MKADSPLATVMESANYTRTVVTKRLVVIHSLETPEGTKWAESLMGPSWFQKKTTQASTHYTVDEDSIIQGVPETQWAWHCGTPGSKYSIGIEQAGYASFSRAQWTTPSMNKQRRLVARLIVDICKRNNIPIAYASDSEIFAGTKGQGPGGICCHKDITRVVGGTTHTDPGTQYPKDLLMLDIADILGLVKAPTIPVEPPEEEDEMVRLVQFDNSAKIWVIDFGNRTKWHVNTMDHLKYLQTVGIKWINGPQPAWVGDQYNEVAWAPTPVS